jgi:multiple sugar transport system substrate-binding protein
MTLAGCPAPDQPAAAVKRDQPPVSRTSVALRVLVVNDPPLAEAVARLRGEWAERSGTTFSAAAIAWDDLSAAEMPEADVVLFPSRYLGELYEKKWLRPVRENVLQGEAVQFNDLFPLVRLRLISYDKQIVALPLGIELPDACFRNELFGERNRLPEIWPDYLSLFEAGTARGEAERSSLNWEPLQSWPAVMLFARAASYAVSSDDASLLFDSQTMKPRLAEPPFVRSLTELRAATGAIAREPQSATLEQSERTEIERKLQDPRAASWHVAAGGANIAFGLPPAGHRSLTVEEGNRSPTGGEQIGWARLPGASDAYSASARVWGKLDRPRQVPLLGIGDRLAAVTTSSRNAATAFQLLAWLAEPEISTQFARAGDGTMPVRRSLASSSQWYDTTLSASERSDLAKALDDSLNGEVCFIVPRIPGIDEYLAALADAVEDVLADEAEPQAALEKAAATWEQITERRGREEQRQAYLRHLGF